MTVTVASIETTTVTRRFKPALAVRSAQSTHDISSFVLVRVAASDGTEGYGEVSATRRWSGEDDTTATHVIRDVIAPALIGLPLMPVAPLTAAMDKLLAGNTFTKAGVNIALWDALGQCLGLPVATLLGGAYRDEVPVKISLSGDGDELRDSYADAVAAGFSAFKVKVGRGVESDVARFALARELAGPDAFLGADANRGWSRVDARRAVPALAERRAAFIEQPLAARDIDGMRFVRGMGLPVVADESVYGDDDLAQVIRGDAADAVSIYIGKSGGLERALHMARMCASFGLDVVIGSNAEFGIGAAAQAHVACACPRLGAIPSDIIGQHFYTEDILAEPLPINGTTVSLPPGPGLGICLDDEIRRQFR